CGILLEYDPKKRFGLLGCSTPGIVDLYA
ncbi:hypothetical protein CISIN_1g0428681mg, partial [Citrus sinensis]